MRAERICRKGGRNSGFTLIELVVSFALLAVVSGIVMGFVSASSGAYRSVSGEVKLQYDAQLAASGLQEYLIDCVGLCVRDESIVDGGVSYTAPTVYILKFSGDDLTVYAYQKRGEELYFGSAVAAAPAINDIVVRHVSCFEVTPSSSAATFVISLERDGKSYQVEQKTALRNKPAVNADLTALIGQLQG